VTQRSRKDNNTYVCNAINNKKRDQKIKKTVKNPEKRINSTLKKIVGFKKH